MYGYLAATKGAVKDWILFGAFTILANYTHVYALLGMVLLHGILLLWVLLKKRERRKPLLLAACVVSVAYLPWLAAIISQTSQVTQDFWIPTLNSTVFWQTLTYPFGDKFSMSANPFFRGVSFIVVVMFFWKSLGTAFHQIVTEGSIIWLAFGIINLTFLTTLSISWYVRPIFMPRYFFTLFGLYTLVLMYGIQSLRLRFLIPIICIMLLGLSLQTYRHIYRNRVNGPMFEVVEQLGKQVQPGDVFVHGDEHPFGTFLYYFPDHRHYLYLPDGFEGYSSYDVFKPNGFYGHDYHDFLAEHQTVWLVNRLGLPGIGFQEISMRDFLNIGSFSIASNGYVFSLNLG